MLKQDLILQIESQTDHYLKKQNKKNMGLMKRELVGKKMEEFALLRPNTYSYLRDHND